MILLLPQIQKIKAYYPPLEKRENFKGLRLDFNERTAPLSPKVLEALRNFDVERFKTYPSYGELENKIANYARVKKVMITNGSDQGIEIIFRAFVKENDEVIIPSPSFSMFFQIARIQGAKILSPEYDNCFPLEEVLVLLKCKPKLLIICNPNNPTGTILSLTEIEEILKKAKNTVVYIDEAYFEFSGITAAGLVEKYENLVITRTFSKAFGLASLRIGYIVSCGKNIEQMLKIRGPYDVNQMARSAAEASLQSLDNMKTYCREVMDFAKPLVESFFRKNKIEFWSSSGNFLFFKEPVVDFSKLLEENGVLIRPQTDGFARVTIGTFKEMKKFIKIFKLCINMLS